MKQIVKIFLFICLILQVPYTFGQEHFELPENKKKDKVGFKLINNLILIPVEVNNVPLTFLLDTGAASTVIFSFEEIDTIELKNSSLIKLRGLGKGEPVDALKSEGNTIQVGKSLSTNQTIYVVFEGALNFSSRLGVPVHGILGKDFFKNFVVEVNNQLERIRFFKPEHYKKRKCRGCVEKDLIFKNDKPHLTAKFKENGHTKDVNLLIDSGSGDALWLFENSDENIVIPENAFEDYLGLGINGSIYGKRSKVDEFTMAGFNFPNVNTAFPDVEFVDILTNQKNRNGSIGGELLKRFNWTINYNDAYIQLKRNKYFNEPFYYNMSGLTLQQGGFTLVKEQKNVSSDRYRNNQNESFSVFNLNLSPKMELRVEQVFVVVEIRKGSPAEIAGIKVGDEILEVNSTPAFKFQLHELNQMFYTREGKTIKMTISRNGYEQKVKFDLKDI
ncbi:MAG: aspartyl protease family protein [Flavobacteriaceae bacterium]